MGPAASIPQTSSAPQSDWVTLRHWILLAGESSGAGGRRTKYQTLLLLLRRGSPRNRDLSKRFLLDPVSMPDLMVREHSSAAPFPSKRRKVRRPSGSTRARRLHSPTLATCRKRVRKMSAHTLPSGPIRCCDKQSTAGPAKARSEIPEPGTRTVELCGGFHPAA